MTAKLGGYNPSLTTVGSGLFADASTTGLIQGQAYPDPATRYSLRTGILSDSETIPMWGGVGIYELIPGAAGGPVVPLGPSVGRATGPTGSFPLAGFSVFDQAYGMINTPQSPVQLAGSYMQVMSYRLGSGARIAVACDPGLVDLQGDPIGSNVAWDYVNQMLIPYTGSVSIAATGSTYTSGTGEVSLATTTDHGLNPGDTFTVASVAGSGADLALVDGTFTAIAGTAGEVLNYTIATGKTISTITGGTVSSGAALAVDVLDVQASGCMTVVYDADTGNATWDYDGACAIIQLV